MPPFLDFETVAIPFGQGLADDVAESLVPAGKAVEAEQAYVDKQGSIQHRPGFREITRDVLSTSAQLDDVGRIYGHHRETLVSAGGRLHSYSPEAEAWADIDHVYEATLAERHRGERGRDAIGVDADVCRCNGWVFYAWSESGGRSGIFVRAVDEATWTKTMVWNIASATDRFRLVVSEDYVHMIHVNVATQIEGVTWDTNDLEIAETYTAISVNAIAPGYFDACSDGDRVYIAWYNNNGGVNSIACNSYTSALVGILGASWPADIHAPIGIDAFQGGQVYVAWQELPLPTSDNGVYCVTINEATMVLLGAALLHTEYPADLVRTIEVVTDDVANACVVWDTVSAKFYTRPPQLRARWVTSLGVAGQGCQVYRVGALSRPIWRNGQVYVGAYCHGENHRLASNVTDNNNRFGYLLQLRFDDIEIVEPEEFEEPLQ